MVGLLLFSFVSLAQTQPAIDVTALDKMAERYVAYGLPLPAKNAELEQVVYRNRDSFGKIWNLPYGDFVLVRPHREAVDLAFNRPLLDRYSGNRAFRRVPEELKTFEQMFQHMTFERSSSDPFSEDVVLALAIQEHVRGHDDIAGALMTMIGAPTPFRRIATSELDDNRVPTAKIALLAKQYWKNKLVEADADPGAVLVHLERIFKDEPSIELDSDKALIDGLQATPPSPLPGNERGEALVERLRNSHQNLSMWSNSPEVLAVIDAGFDAIPALLNHLSDHRVTRAVVQGHIDAGFGSVPPAPQWVLPVGELCNSILRAFANKDYEVPEKFAREAEAWWAEAKAKGEAMYLEEQTGRVIYGSAAYVTTRAYTRRYRNTFSKLFMTALAKHYSVIDTLIWEVREAPISSREKQRLCVAAMRSGSPGLMLSAGRVMNALQLPGRDQELLRVYAALPRQISRPSWNDQQVRLASLALDTPNEEVWRTLTEATGRAEADMRLELIQQINPFGMPTKNYRPYLKYLNAFMDDDAIAPGTDHPTIFSLRIRNEATGQAARVFGLPGLGPWSTEDQWKALRRQVRDRIAAQLAADDEAS